MNFQALNKIKGERKYRSQNNFIVPRVKYENFGDNNNLSDRSNEQLTYNQNIEDKPEPSYLSFKILLPSKPMSLEESNIHIFGQIFKKLKLDVSESFLSNYKNQSWRNFNGFTEQDIGKGGTQVFMVQYKTIGIDFEEYKSYRLEHMDMDGIFIGTETEWDEQEKAFLGSFFYKSYFENIEEEKDNKRIQDRKKAINILSELLFRNKHNPDIGSDLGVNIDVYIDDDLVYGTSSEADYVKFKIKIETALENLEEGLKQYFEDSDWNYQNESPRFVEQDNLYKNIHLLEIENLVKIGKDCTNEIALELIRMERDKIISKQSEIETSINKKENTDIETKAKLKFFEHSKSGKLQYENYKLYSDKKLELVSKLLSEGKIEIILPQGKGIDWNLVRKISPSNFDNIEELKPDYTLLYDEITGDLLDKNVVTQEELANLQSDIDQKTIIAKSYKENLYDHYIDTYLMFRRIEDEMDRKRFCILYQTKDNKVIAKRNINNWEVISHNWYYRKYSRYSSSDYNYAESSKNKYLNSLSSFLVMSKSYLLNMDPGSLERPGFWSSFFETLAESTFVDNLESNRDFIDGFYKYALEHGITLTSKQEQNATSASFIEQAGDFAGMLLPEVIEQVAIAIATEGLGNLAMAVKSVQKVSKLLSGFCVQRFGPNIGKGIYKFTLNATERATIALYENAKERGSTDFAQIVTDAALSTFFQKFEKHLIKKIKNPKLNGKNAKRSIKHLVNASEEITSTSASYFIDELEIYLEKNKKDQETLYSFFEKTFGRFYNQEKDSLLLGTLVSIFLTEVEVNFNSTKDHESIYVKNKPPLNTVINPNKPYDIIDAEKFKSDINGDSKASTTNDIIIKHSTEKSETQIQERNENHISIEVGSEIVKLPIETDRSKLSKTTKDLMNRYNIDDIPKGYYLSAPRTADGLPIVNRKSQEKTEHALVLRERNGVIKYEKNTNRRLGQQRFSNEGIKEWNDLNKDFPERIISTDNKIYFDADHIIQLNIIQDYFHIVSFLDEIGFKYNDSKNRIILPNKKFSKLSDLEIEQKGLTFWKGKTIHGTPDFYYKKKIYDYINAIYLNYDMYHTISKSEAISILDEFLKTWKEVLMKGEIKMFENNLNQNHPEVVKERYDDLNKRPKK